MAQDSYLSGANIEFIEALYERFLEDPASVDASWRELFENSRNGGRPIFSGQLETNGHTNGHGHTNGNGNGHGHAQKAPLMTHAPTALQSVSSASMGLQSRVDQTVYSFRLRGHLLAQLDPLGRPRAALDHVADLGMVSSRHFSAEELNQLVDSTDVFPEKRARLKDVLDRLRRTYCATIGVEYMNMTDSERRRWLMKRMEHSENHIDLSLDEQRRLLKKLSYAEGFESFLHTRYPTGKRFSIDGGESLVPMITAFLEVGGDLGMREVVIAMAHRGRLNVLFNILGKSPEVIFSEFEGPTDPSAYLSRGDVKYHQGFSHDYTTHSGKSIHLSLSFNPSHLEVVYPVAEGRVRAKQDRADPDRSRTVPLIIHGDAAFAGQGIVAETLNLSRLRGYDTGGTVHIVINNQVGFTTDPEDARSSLYATAAAQMLDIPIFHVNGDDPEACVHVMRLATEYRQKFKTDVVIDLVCFRRYGHNEGDEPSFTQPLMYQLVRKHQTVRELYGAHLAERNRLSANEVEQLKQEVMKFYDAAHVRAKAQRQIKEPSFLEGLWKRYQGGPDSDTPSVSTGVEVSRLNELLARASQVPNGFTLHPTVAKGMAARIEMAKGTKPLDWGAGEMLAYATLLSEGYGLRLTGQDVERGTFSHRHSVLHDINTGATFTPLAHLAEKQGNCGIVNSPLSEMGCLGFEFGYSLDYPDGLVVWEAQFGDFANNAQVIIDQFISAAEHKWKRLSGLTMLLPHGYEGMGPEHSSARLERFLQLCATENMQVAYPTTPAQIFHLLRRQVVRALRKPLVVMTPKSLLRKAEATSGLSDFSQGEFKRIIRDEKIDPKKTKRLLLCTGKVYYDLVDARTAAGAQDIAIVRLEQLYPFPRAELSALLGDSTSLQELYWVQEEPQNMGAWTFVYPRLQELASALRNPLKVQYIGRIASASPATGFAAAHNIEQKLIVEEAMRKS